MADAEGARIDGATLRALHDSTPSGHPQLHAEGCRGRTREPELDAIAGPIVRGGVRHAIPTPCTEDLAAQIRGATPDLNR